MLLCDWALVRVSSVSSAATDTLHDSLESASPVTIINKYPVQKFSLETLLRELNFTHALKNRNAVYFGEFPYSYKGGIHAGLLFSLAIICSYVEVLLLDYMFNSVLVNLYENGNCLVPSHSDSEKCIGEGSTIITVS